MCDAYIPTNSSDFVNLRRNPEVTIPTPTFHPAPKPKDKQATDWFGMTQRWTGYNGSHVWDAIYRENCLRGGGDLCFEERVLYRLMSGMHASVRTSHSLDFSFCY